MKQKILMMLVEFGLKTLKPEHISLIADKALDAIEKVVTDSENDIDDKFVLPICAMIREALNVPDDDNIN